MANKNIIKKFAAAGFFVLASFLILWQMLLPGYILTLDMVFTPKIKIFIGQDLIYNTLPVKYFLQLINFILPGWVIQKIVLFLLFFLIGWLGYLFIPTSKKLGANYWAGIFLMANPFVYERFLAGHWMHLMAYAFLAPFSFFAIKLSKSPSWKNTVGLAVCLILIGLFSLHFLVMALILALFYYFAVIANFIFKKRYFELKKVISHLALVSLILLLASSYWLIPYFSNLQKMPASNFSEADWSTFKTAGDLQFGTTINILGLYGFWGEYQPWANYFLWPKANLGWLVILTIILFLSGVGIYSNCKNKKFKELFFFLIAGIIGFIFSAGVGETIFKSFNVFLFNNVWFWSGFRDSQKWSGLLAISYAYFASIGVYQVLKYSAGLLKVEARNLIIFGFLIPVLYTYTIWGGFARQLKPVWYPPSWDQVNKILNQDQSEFKALFMPWHQYLSLSFNQKIISQNPAKDFFDKPIIQGENPEVGQIYSQTADLDVKAVENILLRSKKVEISETVFSLKELGIKYIILSSELQGIDDGLDLDLADFSQVEPVFQSVDLILYKIL